MGQHGNTPFGGSECKSVPLSCPAFRGCLNSLAYGAFFYLQARNKGSSGSGPLFHHNTFSDSNPPISFQSQGFLLLRCAHQDNQDNLPISRSIIESHLPFDMWSNIIRFSKLRCSHLWATFICRTHTANFKGMYFKP